MKKIDNYEQHKLFKTRTEELFKTSFKKHKCSSMTCIISFSMPTLKICKLNYWVMQKNKFLKLYGLLNYKKKSKESNDAICDLNTVIGLTVHISVLFSKDSMKTKELFMIEMGQAILKNPLYYFPFVIG